ncbi:MAG: histidine kinase [Dermatophilaceae bacterium]
MRRETNGAVLLPPWLDAPARVRLGLGSLAMLYAALQGRLAIVLPWTLLVLVIDVAATVVGIAPGFTEKSRQRVELGLVVVASVFAGAALGLAGNEAAPLALATAYHAGLVGGRIGLGLATGAALAACLGLRLLALTHPSLDLGQIWWWLGSSLILGGLGVWSSRLSSATDLELRTARDGLEAQSIIRRLEDLSHQWRGGLHAQAHASSVLEELAVAVPLDRATVLVGDLPESLVPVASHGATSGVWGTQYVELIDRARTTQEPVTDTLSTPWGTRQVLVVALPFDDTMFGAVVADRQATDPFDAAALESAHGIARRSAPGFQAALLFAELREHASLEERDLLAREVHNTIAQDLAAIGYSLDLTRSVLGRDSRKGLQLLDDNRLAVRAILVSIRDVISELRMPAHAPSGLGALLGTAAHRFGTLSGIRTSFTIREVAPDLDPQLIAALHRLVLDVLADAQGSSASHATIELMTQGEDYRLVVSHDGIPHLTPEWLDGAAGHPAGCAVTTTLTRPGLRVEAVHTRARGDQERPGDDLRRVG